MISLLIPLRNAVSFLTVLPTFGPRSERSDQIGRALIWFPLVGALIGWIGVEVILFASRWWPSSVAALLGLVAMTVITGGLHLDGFSDAVDGLGAWRDRPATLRIMRDSRIGALGAAALILLLSLKWSLFQQIALRRSEELLIPTAALGRWAMVLSAHTFPYVPGQSGLGRSATDYSSFGSFMGASCIGFGVAYWFLGFPWSVWAVGLAAAAAWVLNQLFLSRLGGITGDTMGAVNEIVEVLILLLVLIR